MKGQRTMAKPRFKFEMYKRLQQRIPQIYADAKKAAEKLNIPSELKRSLRFNRRNFRLSLTFER